MTLTYAGSTTTAPNPPIAMLETWAGSVENSPGLKGGRVWLYTSTNVAADLTAPGSFSDGYALGMRPGDLVLGVTASAGSSTPIAFMGVVGLVSSNAELLGPSSGAALSSNFLTSTAV